MVLSMNKYHRIECETLYSGCGCEHIRNKKDPCAGGTEKLKQYFMKDSDRIYLEVVSAWRYHNCIYQRNNLFVIPFHQQEVHKNCILNLNSTEINDN